MAPDHAGATPRAQTLPRPRPSQLLRLTPLSASAVLAILALVPEAKFRLREASATFGGSADLQILMEIAIYGAVGIWAGLIALRGLADGRYRFRQLGPTLKALMAVNVFILASGATSLSIRSGVRAVQFTVLVVLGLVVAWESRRDGLFLPATWLRLRRTIVGAVLFAVAASAVLGSVGATDVTGWRYSWFSIHPIPTAGLLGLAIIMIASAFLASPDPMLRRSVAKGAAIVVGLGLVGLLVATRSRAALAGTAAALLCTLLLSRRHQARKKAALAVAAVLILAIALVLQGIGGQELASVVTRGQTAEQITSLSQRTDLFKIGIDLFRERPLFGHGYLIAGPIFSTYYDWAGEAHNLLVEIGVSMGFVGFVVFGWLLLTLGRQLVSSLIRRRGASPGLPLEAAAILLLVLAQAVVADSFAGAVGYEAGAFLWVALIADNVARPRSHLRA